MSGRTRGRSRLSVRYFDDRILLTESHAWAYYRLPTHSYEFLTPPEREALAINITVALLEPSPNTVCVPFFHRSHALQPAAAEPEHGHDAADVLLLR